MAVVMNTALMYSALNGNVKYAPITKYLLVSKVISQGPLQVL